MTCKNRLFQRFEAAQRKDAHSEKAKYRTTSDATILAPGGVERKYDANSPAISPATPIIAAQTITFLNDRQTRIAVTGGKAQI